MHDQLYLDFVLEEKNIVNRYMCFLTSICKSESVLLPDERTQVES